LEEIMRARLPLESKKFLAYIIGEITWKVVIVSALLVFHEEFSTVGAMAWWFMIAVVATAGFVEIGYIGGQAWLDRYVRLAEIAKGDNDEPDPTSPG
jgi:hypothetical protein